jgi:RsiW-degrading membrane proteinase PrsW (M82 family)
MAIDLVGLATLIGVAFGASLLYLFLIRRATKLHREKLLDHLKALGVGSSFSIVAALILSFIMLIPILVVIVLVGGNDGDSTIWAAVLVAPIAEEFTKGTGVMFFKRRFTGLESGLVYGVCVGLGFAAVENVLYGYEQMTSDGLTSALMLLGLRVVSATIGHASYTAITGYGLARCEILRPFENPHSWVKYYLVAVFLHALSNFIASGQEIFGGGDLFTVGSLVLIIAMDVSLFVLIWTKTRRLDREGVHRGERTPMTMPYPT